MKKGEIDMGRIIKNLLLLLCVQLAMLALVGCHHKELCLHHPHEVILKVEFDWRNSPDANPQGMCAFFYPVDGGSPRRFDFKGTKGGEIEITVGQYNVIFYNNDTEAILFGNTNKFEKHQAYTRDGGLFEPIYGSAAAPGPKSEGAKDERVVITPEMLWGGTSLNVDITDTGISYNCVPVKEEDNYVTVTKEEHVIVLYPSDQMCLYSYEIRNVQNIKYATQMSASLCSMAGGMTFATEKLNTEGVTLPLPAVLDKETSTVYGEFYTFGHSPDNPAPHRMLLYVWMNSGDKFYFGEGSEKFNVTSQIHNAPNPRRVHIIIEGLDLPKPIVNGGGYNPSVDDWDEVLEDIIMGS